MFHHVFDRNGRQFAWLSNKTSTGIDAFIVRYVGELVLYHINLFGFHQYVVAVESHQNDEEYRGNGLQYASAMLQSTNLTMLAWRQWLWKVMQGWGNEKEL